MNSFYGGREGAPFILRKSYPNVPAMLDDFKQGLAFTEVRFGEYVIINTESKNHPDNGKIFRRNFAGGEIKYWKKNEPKKIFEEIEKAESAYGAELIGSIVGPAGSVPYFQAVPFKLNEDDDTLVTMSDIKTQYENELFDTQRSCGSFNLTDENLVPGAYIDAKGEQKFNDEIKWDSFSVRTPDADDATAFIEFKVPYNVIDFEANQVNAYTAPTVNKMLAKDEQTHPFYQKWQINIPKGIHGQNIQDFALDKNTGLMTYIIRNYDNKESGEDTSYILNENYPLTWITDISFDDAGNIAIETNNNIENIQKQITWISKVERPENTQVLTIDLNNSVAGNQHIEANLKTPNRLYTEEDGTFKVDYNTGETDTLGGFFYQGDNEEEAAAALTVGGLWIDVVEV